MIFNKKQMFILGRIAGNLEKERELLFDEEERQAMDLVIHSVHRIAEADIYEESTHQEQPLETEEDVLH